MIKFYDFRNNILEIFLLSWNFRYEIDMNNEIYMKLQIYNIYKYPNILIQIF